MVKYFKIWSHWLSPLYLQSVLWSSFVLNMFLQITKGLKVLHDNKIIHRDIKPANIFLFNENKVKIGDMNVSKVAKKGYLSKISK